MAKKIGPMSRLGRERLDGNLVRATEKVRGLELEVEIDKIRLKQREKNHGKSKKTE